MMGFDSPDHLHLSEELLVDCGYTKVIASRVGALGTSIVRAAKPPDFVRAKRDKPPPDESSVPIFPPGKLREFTLAELGKATDNFSGKRLLGRGGFGEVFKGILSDGAVVAVKVLDKNSSQGLEQFQIEMRASCAIMGISHTNLVPAIGYHSSRKRKKAKIMIVYPFMANGDVGLYLGDLQPSRNPLDWPTRKRIALGVARGISSLHELGIVHCDIKPANVMLDEDFNAHVGDLGLAKFADLPVNSYKATPFHGHLSDFTHVYGTRGYTAPELFFTFASFTRKSDVYGFGVTLIQLVTGMPSFFIQEGSGNHIVHWARQLFKYEEDLTGLMLSTMSGMNDSNETIELIRLGLVCTQDDPENNEEATYDNHIAYRAEKLFKNNEDLTRLMHPGMSGMYDENEAIELIRLGLICTQYDPENRPLMPEVIAMMEGSSANLEQRWDNYNNSRSNGQFLPYNHSATEWSTNSFFSVEASGSEVGDEEEVCCSYEVDANEEKLEENADDGKQLQRAEYFPSEDSKKEHQTRLTSSANSRSLENGALDEIVQVDQNERGNPKQFNSQANRYEGPSGEVATKLKEVLDQMREMELKHQAAMEEMHQKQIAIMQSMIKMQGEYIQKVNEMQPQIDQLRGVPQKP